MKLLIVESPNKIEKIRKFLGDDFEVAASCGHIRDLPKREMGVDAPDFKPRYEIIEDKAGIVAKLRKLASNADEVYLATDPDREGEAIAWHLFQTLGLKRKRVFRVRFHSITQEAVVQAIRNPGTINLDLVAAQEARRVIDRMVGYQVSPRLGRGLSAGRVQSPALRLVVERDRAIRNFRSEDYFEVVADIEDTPPWRAVWDDSPFLPPDERYFKNRAVAEKIAQTSILEVIDVSKGTSKRRPPPPFITSTLQQAASSRLGFSPEKTMELAQSLFSQGAITYHRTDCPNLSNEAVYDVRNALVERGVPPSEKINVWRGGGNAQEAHEAIRPVDIGVKDAGDNEDERRLYRLIRDRTLACQAADALYDTWKIRLVGNVRVPLGSSPRAEFVASGRRLVEGKNWLTIYRADDEEEDEQGGDTGIIPDVQKGQMLTCTCRVVSKKTQPPPRYTEAALIKHLERLGIGRPSTYATIMASLKEKGYVKIEKRKLHATEKGETLIDNLFRYKLSFLDYEYTSKMETNLDKIARREMRYLPFMRDFHTSFSKECSVMPEPELPERKQGEATDIECRCGARVERFENCYRCPKCRKTVWREIAGRTITPEEAERLLKGETLRLSGFRSRKGDRFDADVKLVGGTSKLVFDAGTGKRRAGGDGRKTGARRRKRKR